MAAEPSRAREIFVDLINHVPPEKWEVQLPIACGYDEQLQVRVRDLLAAHAEPGSFLEEPVTAPSDVPALTEIHHPTEQQTGGTIDHYKLLQEIGEGGMGVVYMAEQTEPIHRKVALKIIKAGMDSRQVIARFEAERQALALMDHHNIARVLDAGTTDQGRPYFVMELVKGMPITEYCDRNQLTPRERLELFIPVCQAIQHAHQKGIIHRDIKPSNVMVTLYDGRPVPKVIDFGIAKATEQRLTERTLFTELGQIVGTMEYMSPEQAEVNQLDVDTRSDIYSLGALLYELLTGTTPITKEQLREAGYTEMLRTIREVEPPKPSTRLSQSVETLPSISTVRKTEPTKLSRLLRGDLDWIVMKSLEKDRTRRYETANGMAADIERYLREEAIEARPPSASYKLQKFARRNKALLATSLVIAATLLIASVISTWSAIRTARALVEVEQQRNQKELARQEAVTKRQEAQAARQEAEEERLRADDARSEAVRRATTARNRLKIMTARSLIESRPHEALLILREFSADTHPETAMRVLNTAHEAIQTSPFLTERRLLGHTAAVNRATWSPDGMRIVTASDDKTARVWNANKMGDPIVLAGHTEFGVACRVEP